MRRLQMTAVVVSATVAVAGHATLLAWMCSAVPL